MRSRVLVSLVLGNVLGAALIIMLLQVACIVIPATGCAPPAHNQQGSLERRLQAVVQQQDDTIVTALASEQPFTHLQSLGLLCRPSPPFDPVKAIRPRHKLAVIIPYRGRRSQLEVAVPALHEFLTAQHRDFDIFILEQTPRYLFNRGALLNAAVLLLQGSAYDYFAFQDVDTLPTLKGNISYEFPAGPAPLHLTPPGIHPKVSFEDFFGGITVFTPSQMLAVNGYGTNYWGWGKEDDNMRLRLLKANRWPPQRPDVRHHKHGYYFVHQPHPKEPEIRAHWVDGKLQYFGSHPDKPYKDAYIVSAQPELLNDFATGLHTTAFELKGVQPFGNATKFLVELHCNLAETPWCVAEQQAAA